MTFAKAGYGQVMHMTRYNNIPLDITEAFEATVRHRDKHVANKDVRSIRRGTKIGGVLRVGVVDHVTSLMNGQPLVTINAKDSRGARSFTITGEDSVIDDLCAYLFSDGAPNTVWFCPNGKDRFLQFFKYFLMGHVAGRGYEMEGHRVGEADNYIFIRKGTSSWRLCDFNACHGITLSGTLYDASGMKGMHPDPVVMLALFHEEVLALQSFYKREFGISMKGTAAKTGITAFKRFMNKGSVLQRPNPDVFAVCREGGLLRQGHIQSSAYRGQAFSEDVRRQYASLLAMDLPQKMILDHGVIMGERQRGQFLCRISGEGMHPIHIAPYDRDTGMFVRRYHRRGDAICWLSDTAYEGIEALGFSILPVWGYRITEWLNVRPLVEKLQRLVDTHDADSAIGQVLKLIGNATIGKFSSASRFQGYRYSQEEQKGLWPLLDRETRREVPDVWVKEDIHHTSEQQPHIAAYIYDATRTQLYLRIAHHMSMGRTVVHACTDGLMVKGRTQVWAYSPRPRFGEWRLEQNGVETHIRGNNQYTHGTKEKHMGGKAPNVHVEAPKIPKEGQHTPEVLQASTVAFCEDLGRHLAHLLQRRMYARDASEG